MPVYEYSALDAKGKKVSGIMDADSTTAARGKLRQSGMFPVSIAESQSTSSEKKTSGFSFSGSFTKVKPSDITMMTRQLATLINAGFPLVSALDTLIPQFKSAAFKKVISQVKDSIVEGMSFAEALSKFPSVFTPVYINMVNAGETAGTLEIVLERLADISEKQQELNSKVKAALAYPVLMALVGAAVLLGLMTYIVPGIVSIFTDMEQILPLPTRILITVSDFLKSWWWLLVLLLGSGVVGGRMFFKTEQGRIIADTIKLFSPGFGAMTQKLAAARFTRTLGSLLENGVSMMPALGVVKNIVGNVLIADAIEEATVDVGKGQALSASLSEVKGFPTLAVQMIQVGEQSGELENMLTRIADVYEKEVETTVLGLTSLLEPLMILIMGVVVLFIVLSICLPIFDMNQLVQ